MLKCLDFIIPELPNSDRITLILDGAFMASNSNHSKNCLSLFLQDANTKNVKLFYLKKKF